MNSKPIQSLIVKPAGADCNFDCTYCFYLGKSKLYPDTKKHRMDYQILENLLRQAMEQSDKEINISWQGGEPSLMGLDFYKKVIQFEQIFGKGKLVGNGFQTNGMLIDEEWAYFLREYNFLVGLSLDGPQHIHDYYRKTPGGEGTWSKVFKSAELLLQKGVAVNAMSTITDYSADYPEEIYNFLRSKGLTWMQFSPVVETDKTDKSKAADFSLSPEKYLYFLKTIFNLWKKDFKNGEQQTSIRFFENLFYRYVGMIAPECTMQKVCGGYLVVEHNGDVYSCDFFVEPQWKLGNIMKDRLIDMLNSDLHKEFGKIKSSINHKCKTCKWTEYCYGGCPKDRLRDPVDKGHNHFCEALKEFFEYSKVHFEELADRYNKSRKS